MSDESTTGSPLTTEQLAEYLQVSVSLVQKWRLKDGAGPPFVHLSGDQGSVRYRLSDVEAWLASRVKARTKGDRKASRD